MRRVGLAMVLLLGWAGCSTPLQSEYRPLSSTSLPQKPQTPFSEVALRVVLSENAESALRAMEAYDQRGALYDQMRYGQRMLNGVNAALGARFKTVTTQRGAAGRIDARESLILVLDARVTIARESFQTNQVNLTGLFLDEKQQPVETINGAGSNTLGWPAGSGKFGEAVDQAIVDLAKNLDASEKLKTYVASLPTRIAGATPPAPRPPLDAAQLRAKARNPGGTAWALVIGINRYRHADRLNYAVNDAQSVAAVLGGLGFTQVRTLLDQDATKARIEEVIYQDFKQRMGPTDRLFVFFAGHGISVPLPRGGEEGYLIPVDGDPQRPEITAIPMDDIRKMGKRVPAKHIFFAVDACFSGFAITRDIRPESITDVAIAAALEEPVVQVLTAGRKGQKSIEEEGHGLFTRRLLDGLRGAADRDRRGFVTVTGLAAWLSPRVVRDSGGRQHPQYSALDGEGDFVFVLPVSVDQK